MKRFAALLETMILTPSRNAKIDAMARYFSDRINSSFNINPYSLSETSFLFWLVN